MKMTIQKSPITLKKLFVIAAAVCSLASCQEDELTNVSNTAIDAAEQVESNVPSITVTGANTHFAESVDCNTCSFVVDGASTTIDGKELGLKAGSIICLKSGVKYNNLEFVNLEGTTESPIIIGKCK
jgi:hypothetical protein